MRFQFTVLFALLVTWSGNAAADPVLEKALAPYFDLDSNGLDDAERQELQGEVRRITSRSIKNARKAPISDASVPDAYERWRTGVLLRDAYASGVFLDGGNKVADAGATFSFADDGVKDLRSWSAIGSLMYGAVGEVGLQYSGDANAPRITRLGFLGGVEFDTSWVNSERGGSISGKAGFEVETLQGGAFPYQYWKLDSVYTTDWDRDASLIGIEAKWMPIGDTLPIGKSISLNDGEGAWLLFRPSLNVDYSYVSDNGSFGALVPGESYLWGGVKLDLALFFDEGFFDPFSANLKYFLMYDFANGGDDSVNYLELSAKYALNEDETTFLKASYRHGETPRTLTNRDEFFIGLTAVLGDLAPVQ